MDKCRRRIASHTSVRSFLGLLPFIRTFGTCCGFPHQVPFSRHPVSEEIAMAGSSLPFVAVPTVTGLDGQAVEQRLAGVPLRYIGRFPFDAAGQGLATTQNPAPGTLVRQYSIITVDFPSLLGPLDDSPVGGPSPNGWLDGTVEGVFVGERAVVLRFSLDPAVTPFTFT